MPGIIALDIDGTTADFGRPISTEVSAYLHGLVASGWQLVFITGRTFTDGERLLQHLTFPYYFAVQNGAITLHMPQRKIISKQLLNEQIFPAMEQICQDEPTDFVIFAGYEHQDCCYYRSRYFSDDLLLYLKDRSEAFYSNWIDLPSFDDMPLVDFPSIKCFGIIDSATRISQRIEREIGLHAPLIKDPFRKDYYVVQATHASVSKGSALHQLAQQIAPHAPIIAAGDDNNDISMLDEATIRVVMATAPAHLLTTAHVVAPPAKVNGIIQGLQEALNLIKT
jgi:hypothetical protein